MDNWLEALIGTLVIGGVAYLSGKEGQKQGYDQAISDMSRTHQDQEIANLRAELNALKSNQNKFE